MTIPFPDFKEGVTILNALLTPVLACLTVSIARQQWRTNHLKVKHDLYERRLAVYTVLVQLLATIFREARTSDGDLAVFMQKTRESYFLFGPDIADYLDTVYNKSVDLRQQNTILTSGPGGVPIDDEKTTRIASENAELLKWFNAQFTVARKRFSPYMSLS